jgi:hypothetical protein
MSKAIKVWSTEMTTRLTSAYNGDNTKLEVIAKEFGKTVPMVRSKLVSEGVYVPNVKRAVGNASAVRKLALVRNVETVLSMPVGSLDSLEKGSKAELTALTEALIALSDHQDAES